MNLLTFLTQYLDHIVLGILGFMSFLMLTLAIERFLYFRRINLGQYNHQALLNNALTKNLTVISSIAANAPYIGLLGTVIGILITFNAMGQSDSMDVNEIMVGLAMALTATAAGLVVAIPAILIYNSLMRRVDVLTGEWHALIDAKNSNLVIR